MKPQRTNQAGLALALMLAVVACADGPTAPQASDVAARHTLGVGPGSEASALIPVGRDELPAWSAVGTAVIGPEGGELSVNGVTLTVPAGALAEAVRVTVVVPRSPYLEAQFFPHGLTFAEPVALGWDLAGTSASGARAAASLLGVYTGTEGGVLGTGRIFGVLETFDVEISDGQATFRTDHFSGYIVASG